MASGKTHPHIDEPTEEQLSGVIEAKRPEWRGLYLETHRLVLETLPDVNYSVDCTDAEIGYGARQYGYDGWGMAAVTPYSNWVSLGFVRATSLSDPGGLFEGTGATMRHIKIRSPEELAERREAIRQLLAQASTINERA